jgi:hypothetical protein
MPAFFCFVNKLHSTHACVQLFSEQIGNDFGNVPIDADGLLFDGLRGKRFP